MTFIRFLILEAEKIYISFVASPLMKFTFFTSLNSRNTVAQWSAWPEIERLRVRASLEALSKTLYPLISTGTTQEDPSRHDWKNVDWDIKNSNQTNITSLDVINVIFILKIWISSMYCCNKPCDKVMEL